MPEQTSEKAPSFATVIRQQLASAICYEKGHRRGTPAEAGGAYCAHCYSRAFVHFGPAAYAAREALEGDLLNRPGLHGSGDGT